jgi:hypothetical protein
MMQILKYELAKTGAKLLSFALGHAIWYSTNIHLSEALTHLFPHSCTQVYTACEARQVKY